jgi:hypothetical protein
VLGIGGMKADCHNCKAVGWINANDEPSTPTDAPEDIKQLREDMQALIQAYEALQAEHDALKAKSKEAPNKKTGKRKKAK